MLLEDDYTTAYQGFDPNSPESFIFFNLMTSSHFENSIVFAENVDKQMRTSRFAISGYTGIHQDPFWVLWKTSMPAVLLEMGFITNAADLKILRSEEGREEIADKLLSAFSNYKAYYDASADTDVPSGTYFGIQIFGLKKILQAGASEFKGLDVHRVTVEGSGINRYVTGKWQTLDQALRNLDAVQAKFPDAYVVKVAGNSVIRAK